MGIIVDVQPVPNRILEAVKRRILANRAKLLAAQDDQSLRPAAGPRVQRTRFNASTTTYRRPEPAATSSIDNSLTLIPSQPPFFVENGRAFVLDDFVNTRFITLGEAMEQLPPDRAYMASDEYEYAPYGRVVGYGVVTFEGGAGPGQSNAVLLETRSPWLGGPGDVLSANGALFFSLEACLSTGRQGDECLPFTYTNQFTAAMGNPYPTNTLYAAAGTIIVPVYREPRYGSISLLLLSAYGNTQDENRAIRSNTANVTCEALVKNLEPVYDKFQLQFGCVYVNINGGYNTITFGQIDHTENPLRTVTADFDILTVKNWTHLAMCIDGNGRTVSCFAAGTFMGTFTLDTSAPIFIKPDRIHLTQDVGPEPLNTGEAKTSRLYVHGYRISRKIRYRGNFTPPGVIRR